MTAEPPNTAEEQPIDRRLANLKKGKPLKKGFDPRRNLKGVPRDTLLMRKHMRQIAAEIIGSGEMEMTRLDALLRQLWTSRNPAHNKLALQVLDPNILAERVDVAARVEQVVEFDYGKFIKNSTPRPDGDSDASGDD